MCFSYLRIITGSRGNSKASKVVQSTLSKVSSVFNMHRRGKTKHWSDDLFACTLKRPTDAIVVIVQLSASQVFLAFTAG